MAQHVDRDANAALKARFADVYGQYERLRDGMAELQASLAELSASATDTHELIRVTVGPRGQLTSLEIEARAYRAYAPHELADEITRLVGLATADAADAVQHLLADHLPPHSAAMSFLTTGAFPRFGPASEDGPA
ncbi:YbaB/EbfC family nucleoid-associated protein [Catenuloplanes atrovinosus]|uniref:DNA-binding protein YbaB n=1 Tax=Catenuloplanes atrovinosus TaxID=137266 RepID=A0AAE3YWH4_9ACTN|nr:YbaB/EbfC family nucleoid-associated protein [Catenuloplanes atrovinosus]MDR7279186.1 DNA-binding protein YbaB [Catenuloplanes atrovinosus]